MVRFNLLVLLGGLLGYLVSILASTALVLLFFRMNARFLPGRKVTSLFTAAESPSQSLAAAIALGAATLSEAYLLRHAVFAVMALVQDFLVMYERTLFTDFPVGPFLRLVALSALLLTLLSALAVLSIWIAGTFFNLMTRGINEIEEIAKGNVAVAVFFAFVLFAVTAILNEGIEDVSRALIPYSRSGVIRIP